MQIEFKKLTFDPKNGIILEFAILKHWLIWVSHLIMLKRPKCDEERIRGEVEYHYRDRIVKWLFTDELKNDMEAKIRKLIAQDKTRISKMPAPAIFIGNTSEIKHKWAETHIKLFINSNTGRYFIGSWKDIEEMLFFMDFAPDFQNKEEELEKLEEIVDEFLEENASGVSFIKLD